MPIIIALDQQITLFLYQLTEKSELFSVVTIFFAVYVVPLMLVALIIEAVRRHWACFFSAILGLAMAWGFSQLLSFVVNRPRPFITLSDQITPIIKYPLDSSFPSDHTVVAFAVATMLAMFFKRRRVSLILYLLATLVGLSRIATGVHYPTDVLAGAILAVFVSFIWFKQTDRFDEKLEKKLPL